MGGGRGKQSPQNSAPPRRWQDNRQAEKPQNLQQVEEATATDVKDAMPDLIKRVDKKPEGIMQEELSAFVNVLKVIHVDRANNQ